MSPKHYTNPIKNVIRAATHQQQYNNKLFHSSRILTSSSNNFVPHENFGNPQHLSLGNTTSDTAGRNDEISNSFQRTRSTQLLNHRFAFAALSARAHKNSLFYKNSIPEIVNTALLRDNSNSVTGFSNDFQKRFFSSNNGMSTTTSTSYSADTSGTNTTSSSSSREDSESTRNDLFTHIAITAAAASQIVELLLLDPASIALRASPRVSIETPLNQWEFSYVYEDENTNHFVLPVTDQNGRSGKILFDIEAGPVLEKIAKLDFQQTSDDPELWKEAGFVFR